MGGGVQCKAEVYFNAVTQHMLL